MPGVAVSTWSLHRALGPVFPGLALTTGDRPAATPYGVGHLTLLETPAAVASLGVNALEICHFHFPRTDTAYLALLRDRLAAAGVRPLTLLLDAGDITAAEPAARERDLADLRAWIDVAAEVGARQVRVVAGEALPDAAGVVIERAVGGLAALAAHGRARDVEVITENWRPLALAPGALAAIIDGLAGQVGLCVDFGNAAGSTRDADLIALLPYARTVHAKAAERAPGHLDEDDLRHCLDLALAASFAGTYVLIFDGAGDEWVSLRRMVELIQPYLAA